MEHPNRRKSNGYENISSDIVLKLVKLPLGHHCLVLYPNIETIMKIYSEYIHFIMEQKDVVILFLPYYNTTDQVRQLLMTNGTDVKRYERNNSLVLIDFAKVINNPYLGIPAAFGLKEFVNKTQSYCKDKTLVVMADMSLYNHVNNIKDLMEYEKLSRNGYETKKWNQLCFYHKLDFDLMFSDDQKERIFEYHKDNVIVI